MADHPDIQLLASERTPLVDFRFEEGRFLVQGESFPEDVRSFWDGPIKSFGAWLDSSDAPIEFDFKLVYFNSASAKVFLNLLDTLNLAADKGRSCIVRWHHADDDDNIRELGEEFGEGLSAIDFQVVEYSEDTTS